MKRIFPMYKGVSLDKAGMGYSSIQSAKHYMDEKPIRKDFDAALPKNYWYEFEYVHKHNGREMSDHLISAVANYTFHNTDYDEEFYIKDLTVKTRNYGIKSMPLKTNIVNAAGVGLVKRLKKKCMHCLLNWTNVAGIIYCLKIQRITGKSIVRIRRQM